MTNLNSHTQKISLSFLPSRVRVALFSFGFLALAIFVPWLTHQFHLFGPSFLPLHFFTLLAGLAFGPFSGFIVGILSPFVSFVFSGMPPLALLPILIPEIGTYGLISGILRKRNPYFALLVTLLSGRIVLFLMAALFLNHQSPLTYLLNATKTGLPGILLQLLLIPIFVPRLRRLVGIAN